MLPLLRIGVRSDANRMARTLTAAAGYRPPADEPTLFFPSLQAVYDLLTPATVALMRLIAQRRPESVTALARLADRDMDEVTAVLRDLEQHGLLVFVDDEAGRGSAHPELVAERVEIVEVIELCRKASYGRS